MNAVRARDAIGVRQGALESSRYRGSTFALQRAGTWMRFRVGDIQVRRNLFLIHLNHLRPGLLHHQATCVALPLLPVPDE